MSDNNFVQVGEMTACGHCQPEKYGEGMRQAQDMLGDKMPPCSCKCHTKGICITCYENCQTASTCPHVAPKEEEWRNQEPWVSIEGVLWDLQNMHMETATFGEAMDLIKKYVEQHFIPKERVEKWRTEIEKKKPILWNDDVNRHIENIARANTLGEVLSLLSEDK